MGGCIGKLVLIILGIIFFPVSIPILILKSDMKLKNKLLTIFVFWVGLIVIWFFPGKPNTNAPENSTSVVHEEKTEAMSTTTTAAETSEASEITSTETTVVSSTVTVAKTEKTSTSTYSATEAVTGAPTAAPTEAVTELPTKAPTNSAAKEPVQPQTQTEYISHATTEPMKRQYVLNNNTMRYHYPECRSVKDIKEENKSEYHGTSSELKDMGYIPCGNCRPN